MKFIKVNNIDIYFVENNSSEKKYPIIFVHGAGNTSYTWFNQLEINLHNYYPLALDLPGHGRSMGDGFDEISKYSDLLSSFIDTLGFKRVVLCGHSMGGAIVLDFALRYSHKVMQLILVGTGAKLRVAQEILENTKLGYSYSYLACSPKTDKASIEKAEKEFSLTPPIVRYNDFIACNNFNIMDKVNTIDCNTTIIVGRNDQLTPIKYAEFLHREIKNSTIMIIDDAGHNVMWEKPDEVNKVITSNLI
jgi:pimeloyl-ACP methyl ester carboxylesterase